MTQLKRRFFYSLAGYSVSLMYSYGIALSLIFSHLLNFAPLDAFKYTALFLLIITVLFYNRWTFLITIIGTAILTYWLIRYGAAADWALENVPPFISEALNFVQGNGLLSESYHIPLGLVFIGATVLFSRISASRLRGCPSMLIVAAAVFITEWLLGHHNIVFAMALSATSIAAVFAYSFARHLFLRDMSDAEEDYTEEDELFSEGETVKTERRTVKIPNATAIAAYAIPLALLASILASTVLPENASAFHSIFVEKIVDDVVDYIGQNYGLSRKQYSFSISSLGYSSTSNLGGPVVLSGDTALVVEGISPSLLKGSARTYYTGKGWTNLKDLGSYRLDSALWTSKRADVFDLERPDIEDEEQLLALYRTVNLRITPYRNLYTLFSPTRPLSIGGSKKDFIPYFNNVGELYPKRKLSFMSTYWVKAHQILNLSNKVTNYIVKLEKELPPEDAEKMAELRRIYLQLPDDLPAAVQKIASDTAQSSGSDSPFLRAMAIRQYFLDNFNYTLSPTAVPKDRDFVEYFLETKEGYCTYYATGMVVLARSAGIPARYCEGFLLTNAAHEDSTYTVTGKNAHAWAELYFEGIGWLPFDATPIGQPQPSKPEDAPVPTEPNVDIPTPSPSAPIEPVVPIEQSKTPGWVILLLVLAALVFIDLSIILIHREHYSRKRLLKRFGKQGAVEIWWRSILDMLPYQDIMFKRRDGETSTMLAARIGPLVQCKVCTLDQLVRIVMRSYYSRHETTDVEIEVVYRYYRAMERRMLRIMTPPIFTLKRVFFPRSFGFRGMKKK